MKRRNSSTQARTKLRKVTDTIAFIVALLNVVVILLMLTSACGVWINPVNHATLSCVGYPFTILQIVNALFFVIWLIFRIRLCWIPIVGMLLCYGATFENFSVSINGDVPEGAIKVLSYNVMGFNDDGTLSAENHGPIVDYILDSDADIVCLQETYQTYNLDSVKLRKIFEERYPHQAWSYVGVKDSGSITVVLSHYPILSSEVIDYQSTSNGSSAQRILIGGDTVCVINNHFESNKFSLEDRDAYKQMIVDPGKETLREGYAKLYGKLVASSRIRGPQADSVHSYIERCSDKYVVVCGDFNSPPISYVHHRVEEGLVDAFAKAGNGFGISFNNRGFYFRIDNVMVSKSWKVYSCKVDDSIGASDHYPVVCWIGKREE